MVTKVRTLDFLPDIFRTTPNQQFLSATLDQLVQQPNTMRIQGYVGRKFEYGINSKDSYVLEPNKVRTDYQLEPAVVFTKQDTATPYDFISYPEIIDALKIEGSPTKNNSSLFSNQFYSWDSFVDLDKLINFNQYYWLPNGPDSVEVTASTVDFLIDYQVNATVANAYTFTADQEPVDGPNPALTLVRGGTYTFRVKQKSNFWIQTLPGVLGQDPQRLNVSTRDVYGVENNGERDGIITFTVPATNAQQDDVYPGNHIVDLVTALPFSSIQGKLLSDVGDIDGITILNGKTIMFYGYPSGSVGDISTLFDIATYDQDIPVVEVFDEFKQTDLTTTFYRIVYNEGDEPGNPILLLEEVSAIPTNERITAIYGTTYSNISFVKNAFGIISIIPAITAPNSLLYYQDGTNASKFGVIKLIDSIVTNFIDVDVEILDKKTYQSPTGVTFTNGLKVYFSGNIIPYSYQEGEYYVEGVGTAIKLLPVGNFKTPERFTQQVYNAFDFEPYDTVAYGSTLNLPVQKDYITINRAALDRNAWSRSNRWFHVGVLQEVIKHNTASFAASIINSESSRAKRPVVEFYPNLKLFDSGTVGKNSVTFIDTTATDALTNVSGKPSLIDTFVGNAELSTFALSTTPTSISYISASIDGIVQSRTTYNLEGSNIIFKTAPALNSTISVTISYFPDGVDFPLFDGCTVIFANDDNIDVRNKVYLVSVVSLSKTSAPIITLSTVAEGDILFDDQVSISIGNTYQGSSFYFDGTTWVNAQEKINVNQPPLFEIFDQNGISLSDSSYYTSTDFVGCTLFEYAIGTGSDDPVLGFPLKYNAVNNIGDIGFNVSLNENTFTYVLNNKAKSQKVNIGFPRIYESRDTYTNQLGWQTAVDESFQYQAFDFTYNPETRTNAVFVCDVPAKSADSTLWPTIRVMRNSEVLIDGQYTVTISDTTTTVTLLENPLTETPIQVLIYSDLVGSGNSYFTVPTNLANNPFNYQITALSLGDIRGHYQSACVNSGQISGIIFGSNNYRDLGNLVPFGNKIIQNSAPLPLAATFLRRKDFSLIDSLTYSGDEYVKFKTLLLDTVNKSSYSTLQTSASILDDALNQISSYKSEGNAFFWSDMLPNKSAYTTNTYKFNAAATTTFFALSRTYDFNTANYYGILIYLTRITNGVSNTTQLIKGVDYIISDDEPKVTVLKDLESADLITISEYNQTYGSFVPNTPAKLGFVTATVPEVVLETTYLTPTYFIRGHDGSLSKLYGIYNNGNLQDFRDRALFEFELRIYNNLKVSAAVPVAVDEVFSGQFRTTDFSYDEVMNLYSMYFLNWVGKNRIDYKTQYYLTDTEYTWNFSQSANKLDNTQFKQGNWKGIFNWFYDTVTPATTPWEMLGYNSKPVWWETRYGAAPYTSDNFLLWNDLELGFDYNAGVTRILPNKARPGLSHVLPVDSEGKQIGPMESVVGNFDALTFNRNWKVGDIGPAEYSYLNSSSWSFDLVKILALCKPAKFFALGQNLDVYKYDSEFNQYLVNGRTRLSTVDTVAYGSGVAQHSYMDWIVDYVQSTGAVGFDKLSELLRNLDVRLVYRLAGFSDKDLLNFYVERTSRGGAKQGTSTVRNNNSLLIPTESFSVVLHENQAFSSIQYSGIIIQKTGTGFSVYGNSQNKVYFKTFTPLVNGNYTNIEVANLKVLVSKNYSSAEAIVPYGTDFKTPQALAQFIMSYGQCLADQGIKFENIENNIVIDWSQIIAEILYWIQSGWEIGAIINVNPIAKNLVIDKENSIVQPLTIQNQNYILNQNLVPIQLKDMAITRNGTMFDAVPLNDGDTISYFTVNMSNLEHAVIFDNTTLFNDLLYDTTTGLRQNRLLLKGIKTADWTGTLDTQGFILNQANIQEWKVNTKYTKGVIVTHKNNYWISNSIIQASAEFQQSFWVKTDYEKIQKGMLPNASTRAYEASLYYDTASSALENDADLLSYSLIGYRPRNYLAAANLDEVSQVNLYKTFIVEKGSKNSISAIQGISIATGDIQYSAYENWAIKDAQYGGVLNQNFVEFKLNEQQLTGNPNIIGIVGDDTPAGVMQQVPLSLLTNYNQPLTNVDILPLLPKDTMVQLPSAGYVSFDDVALSAYSFSQLSENQSSTNQLFKNDYVWIAERKGSWNIFTPIPLVVNGSPCKAINVINNLNNTSTVVFDNPHGLVTDDMIIIVNYNATVDGFYTVISISDLNSVTLDLVLPPNLQTSNGNGIVAKFVTQRVATPKDIGSLNLLNTEFVKNKVWVDAGVNGNWEVYRKSINYTIMSAMVTPANAVTFGSSVAYDSNLGYFVGDAGAGKVFNYTFNNIVQTFGQSEIFIQGAGFGSAIETASNILVVSEPNAVTSKLYVYALETAGTIRAVIPQQTISIAGIAAGKAMAISGDAKWLYVSAFSENKVLAYKLNTSSTFTTTTLTTSSLAVTGTNVFKIIGNNLAVFAVGSTISFDNLETAPTYKLNAIQYDADTNTTSYYINSHFVADVESGSTIYKVTSSYSSAGSFTAPGVIPSDNFGYSISTNHDGSRVFVSAPNSDYSGTFTDTGSVYAFSRIVQVFDHRYNTLFGQPTVFTLAWTPVLTPAVTLNGKQIETTSYSVAGDQLSVLVQVNAGDLVEVSSSDFIHTKTIIGYDETDVPRVGILFGHSIDNNQSASEFIVGAPFDVSADNIEGSVYRYTNGGKKYGMITGISPAVLSSSATILLNGFAVTLPIGNVTTFVSVINDSNIPNVTASETYDGKLLIQLVNPLLGQVNNKLNILAFDKNVLDNLGIIEYNLTQILQDNSQNGATQFGSLVKFNEFNSFVVSAPTSTRFTATAFDFTDDEDYTNDTTFDNNFTVWIDNFVNAGAVYMFDYLPAVNENITNTGNYVLAQPVNDTTSSIGSTPYYGKNIAFNGYQVVIGNPTYFTGTINGNVTVFQNKARQPNWVVYRTSTEVVDINKLHSIQLYDNISNTLITPLDFIDPLQGKLFGVVRENLDFISNIDPAGYNTEVRNNRVVWSGDFVGKMWFDTSGTKFVDYHQADIVYNSKYWGTVFPGSIVSIYTWLESDVLPINYSGLGTPYALDAFTTVFDLDNTGAIVTRYYYWVKDTSTIINRRDKTLSDSVLASYISNPASSGISFFAPYKSNVFGIYNASEYINSTNTSIHLGFKSGNNDDTMHNEFQLVRDGFADDFLNGFPSFYNTLSKPIGLYQKMLDSLAGVDTYGQILPDPYLPILLQTGTSTRPRQSFFANRLIALRNYISYANAILARYPITEIKNSSFLNLGAITQTGAGAPTMFTATGEINPSTVNNPQWLGSNLALFDANDYWEYISWWAEGFNSYTRTDVEVSKYYDLASLDIFDNMIAGVASNSDGKREVYIYTIGQWKRIGLQQGTIKIKDSLWDYKNSLIGFGEDFFDTSPFDTYPSTEAYYIIRGLNEEVFVEDLLIERNRSLILLFEYITSENVESQNYLPWLNKTSLMDVQHTLRELNESTAFQSDDDTFLEGYLNEVKPYHVVLKEFSLRYTKTDAYQGDFTDFDLPAKYNSTLDRFTTPELVFQSEVGDDQFYASNSIWETPEYSQWFSNFGLTLSGASNLAIAQVRYHVNRIDNVIAVDNAFGFPIVGIIKINDELIGYSSVDRNNGILSNLSRGLDDTEVADHFVDSTIYIDLPGVIVYNTGRDYIDPPSITAYIDTKIYPEPKILANLKPIMSGGKLVGVTVINPGSGYAVTPELIVTPSVVAIFNSTDINFISYTINIASGQLITGDLVQFIAGPTGKILGLEDGKYYYVNVSLLDTSSGKVPVTLHTNSIDAQTGIRPLVMVQSAFSANNTLRVTARIVPVVSNSPIRQISTTLKFDRTSYLPKVTNWLSGEFYSSIFIGLDDSEIYASSGSRLMKAVSFNSITGETIPSGGTGAVFDISNLLLNGTWSVSTVSPGKNYSLNDQITNFSLSYSISRISREAIAQVTTRTSNQLVTGTSVRIFNVDGMPEIQTAGVNYTNEYYIRVVSSVRFLLYSDRTLTTPVNSSAFQNAFSNTGSIVFELADCAVTVTNVDPFEVTVAGTPWEVLPASAQGAVLTITNVSSEPITGDAIISVIYAPSTLRPGAVKNTQLYFYNLSVPYIYNPIPNVSAKIKVTSPKFDGTTVSTQYAVEIEEPGTIYSDGEKITILGTNLGGASPANDLIITVKYTNSGAILYYTTSGIAASVLKQYYVYPINDTQLKVYQDASLNIPIPNTLITPFPFSAGAFAYIPEPIIDQSTYGSSAESYVAYNHKIYRCLIGNNDLTFDYDKWEEIPSNSTSINALDRVVAYYQPTRNMPGNNLPMLMTGLEYPNNTYLGNKFDPAIALPLDTILKDQPFYPVDIQLTSIIFDGVRYFAVGNTPTSSVILTSNTGVEWTFNVISSQNIGVTDITYSGSFYAISATNLNSPILISYDAINWVSVGTFTPFDTTGFSDIGFDSTAIETPTDSLYAILAKNDTFIGVGLDILLSDSAFVWSQTFSFYSSLNNVLRAVSYFDNASFTGYVAVGSGEVVTSAPESAFPVIAKVAKILSSFDGIVWNTISINETNTLNTVFSSPNRIIIAGNNNTIYYSPNGQNWLPATILNATVLQNFTSGIFALGLYILVGDSGAILYSFDGIEWSQTVSVSTYNLNKIIEANGTLLAVGENGTILKSTNVIDWTDVSFIETDAPFYDVKGDPFTAGYGPEELVAGIMYDHLSMTVTTSPGSLWTPESLAHCGFTMIGSTIVPNYTGIISFAGMVQNPAQLAVYIIDQVTHLGRRIYENATVSSTNPITYTINWRTKTITLSADIEENQAIFLELYEIGGGNQQVKGTSDSFPILLNSATRTSYIDTKYPFDAIVTDPAVYVNGVLLEFNVDYTLLPNSLGNFNLTFTTQYDPLSDYISFAILGSTIVPEYEDTQYGYSLPQTQVFDYFDTNIFNLTYFVEEDNPANAIVELNGNRLIEGLDYSIDPNSLELSVNSVLAEGDIISATTFNKTGAQYLVTDYSTTLSVTPIYYVETSRTPLVVVTTTDPNFSDGEKVTIDGLIGSSQLANSTYFVKVTTEGPTIDDPTVFYLLELFLDNTLINPVIGPSTERYVSGGFIWRTDETIQLTQPNFAINNASRLFVSVNGKRVGTEYLRMNSGNYLNIMAPIAFSSDITVTSMIPSATPNAMTYNLVIDKTGLGSVYRANLANRTWLTEPLYTTQDSIVVYDVTKLVNSVEKIAIVEQMSNMLAVRLEYVITDIKQVNVYNTSKLVALPTDDYIVTTISGEVYVIFNQGVDVDDNLTMTIRFGDTVLINGEKIKFNAIDYATNTLSLLSRGVDGTTVVEVQPTNSVAYSLAPLDKLSDYYYDKTWNSVNSSADGDPLQISDTFPAEFLKS